MWFYISFTCNFLIKTMWCDYHQPIINYDDTLRVLKLRKYLLKYRHALQIFVKILYQCVTNIF